MSSSAAASKDRVEILATERARLVALASGDADAAKAFHHPDFQLITPRGIPLSREQYLDEIATGRLRYVSWEPEDIAIRQIGDVAVIRYRARIEMDSDGARMPGFTCWHTDSYERIDGRWLVVWSQATTIRS